MILSNFHTHTIYCDGKNTPEEMVLSAIDKGFSSLGFSGHAYMPCDDSYCMSPANTQKYIDDINLLKEKYKNQIKIYLGIEYDLRSEIDRSQYDYLIGSVHCVKTPDGTTEVDASEQVFLDCVNTHFDGNFYAYCRAYYDEVKKLGPIRPDFIGHIDIVTKYNEGNKYFDTECDEYLTSVYDAIDALLPYCNVFEMNTGAISRGVRTTPYPSVPILKRLYQRGADIILTSDCHDARFLDCHYKECVEILKSAGFLHTVIFENNTFTKASL